MTELVVANKKRLVLLAGRSHPQLANQVAQHLGIPLSKTTAFDFANGEIFVRFRSRCAVATRSSSKATRPRSINGSWSNSSWLMR